MSVRLWSVDYVSIFSLLISSLLTHRFTLSVAFM